MSYPNVLKAYSAPHFPEQSFDTVGPTEAGTTILRAQHHRNSRVPTYFLWPPRPKPPAGGVDLQGIGAAQSQLEHVPTGQTPKMPSVTS